MIGADDENTPMTGIDVEIVQEIARRLGREIVFCALSLGALSRTDENRGSRLVEQRV